MTHRLALSASRRHSRSQPARLPPSRRSQPASPAAAPAVQKAAFGTTKEGAAVEIYTLTNRNGMTAKVTTYGATLTELLVPGPGRQARATSCSASTRSSSTWRACRTSAATVGRVGNRIAKGAFTLDGQTYTLATNNGPNHLHGGLKGFDKVVWKAEVVPVVGGAGRAVHLPQPGRRGRLPGQPRRGRDLHAHGRQRTAPRLLGHDRQGHAGQPDQPQLLQPGGRRRGRRSSITS